MAPLVSVMIPCYDSANTLPLALASVIAQTYQNWECIVVDDGSTDRPVDVVEIINDPRIRFHRFEHNCGRAAARQQALDMAKGDYLCMVDADDWIYPWKIEKQVAVMARYPGIAVLSTGMAIVDATKQIIGVRSLSIHPRHMSIFTPLARPATPPIAHAPAIIRMSVAKANKYDLRFSIAEDADFLLRILLKHNFATISEITYAYSEAQSYSLEKMITSLQASTRMFAKYKDVYPAITHFERLKAIIKTIVYRMSFLAGIDHYLVKRRSHQPSAEQVEAFHLAQSIVNTCEKRF